MESTQTMDFADVGSVALLVIFVHGSFEWRRHEEGETREKKDSKPHIAPARTLPTRRPINHDDCSSLTLHSHPKPPRSQ